MKPLFRLLLMGSLSYCATAGEVTFYREIAPILHQYCAPCHHAGGPAPFSLVSYGEARRHAGQVAAVTARRAMPPWMPEPQGVFENERRLTDQQIRAIAQWLDEGTPAGASSADWPASAKQNVPFEKPDLLLPAEGFILPPDGPGRYQEIELDVPLDRPRWVRAINIQPGNNRAVRTASLFVLPGPAANPDLSDPTVLLSPATDLYFWTPWLSSSRPLAGTSWRLAPKAKLTLRLYVQPTGKPETIKPSVGLYFTETPPAVFPILLGLKGLADIPAGATDFVVADDFRLPTAVEVRAIYPEAGNLGQLLQVYASLPDGTLKWLLRIPSWDPSWQEGYRYKDPIVLPRGAVVSMRFHYQNLNLNGRTPNLLTRSVPFGDRPGTEIACLWLQVIPIGSADQRAEMEKSLLAHQLSRIN